MERVCIFDYSNIGHHWSYNFQIMKKLKNTREVHYFTSGLSLEYEKKLEENNIIYKNINKIFKNKILNELEVLIILFKLYIYCKKNNISKIYFVYFDSLIRCYFLEKILFNKYKKIFTIHWYTNSKIKLYMLNKIIKNQEILIVHTIEIKKKFNNILNKNNIKVINYPILGDERCSKKDSMEKLNIKNLNNHPTILFIGSTNKYKGCDILLNSLININQKFNLIIAGKESDVKFEDIKKATKLNNKINTIIRLGYIPDEDIKYYYGISDIVVLPYRKEFLGESGIFNEAIYHSKPIVASNVAHFDSILSKEKNGVVFRAEDSNDLAKKICKVIINYNYYEKNAKRFCESYCKIHSEEQFNEKYNTF